MRPAHVTRVAELPHVHDQPSRLRHSGLLRGPVSVHIGSDDVSRMDTSSTASRGRWIPGDDVAHDKRVVASVVRHRQEGVSANRN